MILLIISSINEKLLNSNNNRSKPKFVRLLGAIVVFRLVAYLLNMICLNLRFLYKLYIHKFSYKFETFLYQVQKLRIVNFVNTILFVYLKSWELFVVIL